MYNGPIQLEGNFENTYTVKMPVTVSCHCTPGYSVMKKMLPQSDLVRRGVRLAYGWLTGLALSTEYGDQC